MCDYESGRLTIIYKAVGKGTEYMSCLLYTSGFPILTAVFPERSGLYIAAYIIVETIMTWTAGVGILSASKGKAQISFKKMITPSTVALLIALALIFAGFTPKGTVWEAMTGVGNVQKYIGLLYIGAVSYTHLKSVYGFAGKFHIIISVGVSG